MKINLRILLKSYAVFLALLPAMGCVQRPSEETNKDAVEWFQMSTGLELPKTSTVVNAASVTSIVSTYYIQLSTSPELEKLLTENFEIESNTPKDLTLPQGWDEYVPFWSLDKLKSPKYFSRIICDKDGKPEWWATVAYDSATGKCFFLGEQCR